MATATAQQQVDDRAAIQLKKIQRYAAAQRGRCTATSYQNAHQKLDFECGYGHQWQATWSNLAKGQWCPLCRRQKAAKARRLGIESAQSIAKERGGECLSKRYKDNRTPLSWRCSRDHTWKARLDQIRSAGAWCPECARQKLSRDRKGLPPPSRSNVTIADVQAFARRHAGRCLTDVYVNQRQVLDWECRRGHRFRSSWVNTQSRDNFCSECAEIERKQEILKTAKCYARSVKGRCLSTSYKGARAPLKWQCKLGHRFTDTWTAISNRDHFCTRCS